MKTYAFYVVSTYLLWSGLFLGLWIYSKRVLRVSKNHCRTMSNLSLRSHEPHS